MKPTARIEAGEKGHADGTHWFRLTFWRGAEQTHCGHAMAGGGKTATYTIVSVPAGREVRPSKVRDSLKAAANEAVANWFKEQAS